MSFEPTQPLRRPDGLPQDPPEPESQPEPEYPPESEYPPEPPTVGRPAFNPDDQPPVPPQPGYAGTGYPPGPGYGQPPYDQPRYDQPPYDQPAYGQPPADQPQYGPPQYTPPPVPAKPRKRRRGGRRVFMSIFTLIVVAILLLIGDRVANAIAENDMADQFTANGFPVKPSVDITGFPFLTQLAARDFRKVDISASNIPAGPVSITSLHATLTGMHIHSSFNAATIDKVTATAFVSFGALEDAGGLGNGTGITMTPDGPDRLKITAGIGGIVSDTEEAEIKQTGPQQISVQLLNNGGALGSLLSGFGSFKFNLPPGVPPSLRITGFTINDTGLTLSAAATDATFSSK